MLFTKEKSKTAIVFLETLFSKDKTVRIEEVKGIRSNNQNSLYWLWLSCIAKETGNDKDDLHDEFRNMFLEKRRFMVLGKEKEKNISTTVLNTNEFKQYLDKIQIFMASEYGIALPNPEDENFKHFEEAYKGYI